MADQSPQAGAWVLAPREATETMIARGLVAAAREGEYVMAAAYRAMLAARPAAPPSASAARIAALEKALEPFAFIAEIHTGGFPDDAVVYANLGACRHARSLLSTEEGDNG